MFGYLFNLSDAELITRCLNPKITGNGDSGSHVKEVNICCHEPADIARLSKMESTDTWIVISRVEKLGAKGKLTKRATTKGHWGVTGKRRLVTATGSNTIVGYKKYLTFKENKESPSSSVSWVWVIHELHSLIDHPNKDAFVLCKLMKKSRNSKHSTSSPSPSPSPITSHSQQTVNNNTVEDSGANILADLEDFDYNFKDFESIAYMFPTIFNSADQQ